MCNIIVIYLPTLPTCCCYTTLGKLDVARKVWQDKVRRGCTKTDALSLSGSTSLIFVNFGTKIDGCYYRDVVLMHHMLPSIRSTAGDAYLFQQDNAPAHHARPTVELLQRETPKFIAPDLWPPNSPDLNAIDYRIWGVVQDRVYQTTVRDVTDLKQHLTDAWNGLLQSTVDDAVVDEWRKRHKACLKEKGRHFWTFAVITELELAWLCT